MDRFVTGGADGVHGECDNDDDHHCWKAQDIATMRSLDTQALIVVPASHPGLYHGQRGRRRPIQLQLRTFGTCLKGNLGNIVGMLINRTRRITVGREIAHTGHIPPLQMIKGTSN